MKIHVPSIPEEGMVVPLDSREGWLKEILLERIPAIGSEKALCTGQLRLFRTNGNVTVQGRLSLNLHPACDRCAKTFAEHLDIPLLRHMTPYFSRPDDRREEREDVELSEEDLEFSCYHGEEIDLADLIAEEILLALPMRFLCREGCLGLCPHCGADLNKGPCSCPPEREASPFAVLKKLKLKSVPK